MKIEIEADTVLEKIVKKHGAGGGVYLPKNLIGKKVKIIVLKDED